MKVSVGTISRTIALVVTLANTLLTAIGKNPFPWSENEVYNGVSTAATIIATAAAWWKNNSFTQEAINADKFMKELKEGNRNENN